MRWLLQVDCLNLPCVQCVVERLDLVFPEGWQLFSALLSTIAAKVSLLQPMTEPAFLIGLFNLHREEDLPHLAAHFGGSGLPQVVESAAATAVLLTLQFSWLVVDGHTQVLI